MRAALVRSSIARRARVPVAAAGSVRPLDAAPASDASRRPTLIPSPFTARGMSRSASAAASASASASSAPPRRRFIDIGANLTDGMFRGEYHGKTYHEPDLDVVLRRAWDVGVEKVMVTAGTLREAREAIDLADRFDRGDSPEGAHHGDGDPERRSSPRRLFTTVGVHPTRCGEFEASGDGDAYLQSLVALAVEPGGEGGFVATATWNVAGSVGHWGHVHERRNRYRAELDVAPADGLWKLVDLEILEEQRL